MNFKGDQLRNNESLEAKIEADLLELGIEALPENVEAAMDYQATLQHPKGFEEIINNMNNPEELKKAMQEKGIKKVVHSEGVNVWDHCKAAIKEAETMDIPEDKKEDLKLIMLYHDLGKTYPDIKDRRLNVEILKKELGKERGKLYQPMAGHADERLFEVKDGFRANGLSEHKVEVCTTVVKNHMNGSLLEMSTSKLVKLIDGFGADEATRKEVVELLVLALLADGNANQHIELMDDGELKFSKNEKKLGMDFDRVWEKYQEGKKAAGR